MMFGEERASMIETTDVAVLDECRKVEEGAARFYHLLAELHADRTELAELWSKTAREEENHAQQVALVRRRHAQIALAIRVDHDKTVQALKLIDATMAEFRDRTPMPRRALLEAILMEEFLSRFHAEYAIEFHDPNDKKLFQSMMAADQDHIGALQRALDALPGQKTA